MIFPCCSAIILSSVISLEVSVDDGVVGGWACIVGVATVSSFSFKDDPVCSAVVFVVVQAGVESSCTCEAAGDTVSSFSVDEQCCA